MPAMVALGMSVRSTAELPLCKVSGDWLRVRVHSSSSSSSSAYVHLPRRRWLAALAAVPRNENEGSSEEAIDFWPFEDSRATTAQAGTADQEERTSTPEEEEEDRESVRQILRVLEILKNNRDMTPNEVRLTVMIEDPRQSELEQPVCSRDDMAAALQEIIDGKIPKDRVALQALTEEMLSWPNLDEMIEKKDLRESPYARITDTGVDPAVAAQRAKVDWDQAAEFSPEQQMEIGDQLPPAVGYSFLYLVTLVPLIIGFSVVAILFVNSFQ